MAPIDTTVQGCKDYARIAVDRGPCPVLASAMLPAALAEQWDLVRGGTVATARLIPDAHLDFRPHPDMITLGELNFHIISAFYFLARRRLGLDITIPQVVKDKQPIDREVFLAQLAATDEIIKRALAEQSPAWLAETSYTDKQGKAWTNEYMLWHVSEHEIHHRAQLRMYLKLLDVDTSGLPY